VSFYKGTFVTITPAQLQTLHLTFGKRLQTNVSLKRYTAARLGGITDVMITVGSSDELAEVSKLLWESHIPFIILGNGSNILVSDKGMRQVVILNHAKKIKFDLHSQPPTVWVESGANFGALSRQAAARGLSGLEWAAGIPGTVGGAVYGNAGAHGSDMSNNLLMANILHHRQTNNDNQHEILREEWAVERFEYAYRSSSIKRQPGQVVVLSAQLKLGLSTPEAVQAKMDVYKVIRQSSQPYGASLGSIFKNPPGDYAGRLIEAAGLKGEKIGKVEISQKHGNFIISQDSATASDYAALIKLAQVKVLEKFGINLELEIELLGDWKDW
jgi:UDP-N-acetylmuramate dehydrogenase